MIELKEIYKTQSKTQKDEEVNNDKKSNESYRTQAKIGQIALMQRTNFKEA